MHWMIASGHFLSDTIHLAFHIGGIKVDLESIGDKTLVTAKCYECRELSNINKVLHDYLMDNNSKIDKVCFGL